MSKKKVNMPFHSIWPRIWADASFRQLDDIQKIFFIFSFSAPNSSDDSNVGIYEIDTGGIAMFLRIDISNEEGKKKLDGLIDFFNFEKPNMLEYDRKHHILFCKNYVEYQSHYLSAPSSFIPALLSDWYATRDKVPYFWQKFYFINEEKILEMNELAKKHNEKPPEKSKKSKKVLVITKIPELTEFIVVNSANAELAKQYWRGQTTENQLTLF